MDKSDAIKIIQQTKQITEYAIVYLKHILNYAGSTPFKMILIDSGETLKERQEMLENCLKEVQGFNFTPDRNALLQKYHFPENAATLSDKQIASLLFDLCNNSVKEIYTLLNQYKAINEKITKKIKEAIKAIERLREQLADYL